MLKRLFIPLIILITALSYLITPTPLHLQASAEDVVYAYLKSDIILYEKTLTPINGNTYIPKTTLPRTYFVALLQEPQESTDGYIKVSYLDIEGYAALNQLEIVDYEPVYKYAEPTLTLYFDGKTINLRTSPDHTIQTNILNPEIPSSTTVLYYGTVIGTAMFSQTGTTWYFIRYTIGTTDHYGYIYNAQASLINSIPENVIEKVIKETPKDPENESPSPKLTLTPTTQTILIICLCIPAALIMMLLFQKPTQKPRQPRS